MIDWFEPWPEQALQSVASVFLAEEALPEDLRPEIVEHMITVHQSVRTFSARFQVRHGDGRCLGGPRARVHTPPPAWRGLRHEGGTELLTSAVPGQADATRPACLCVLAHLLLCAVSGGVEGHRGVLPARVHALKAHLQKVHARVNPPTRMRQCTTKKECLCATCAHMHQHGCPTADTCTPTHMQMRARRRSCDATTT